MSPEEIQAQLADYQPDLNADQLELLARFQLLLLRWNKTHNLTAITDPAEMVTHHLIDSISIHPYLTAESIADIGSGGGLPAIPLAILNPQRQFTLIEAVEKKVNFLRQAVIELGLENTEAVHCRVEEYRPESGFGQISSRAFASIGDFIEGSRHLLAPEGQWLAMKGRLPEAELAALADNFKYTVRPLTVPGLEASRHLITINNG